MLDPCFSTSDSVYLAGSPSVESICSTSIFVVDLCYVLSSSSSSSLVLLSLSLSLLLLLFIMATFLYYVFLFSLAKVTVWI